MIDAHRGAFEYDWRTRFNQERGLSIVGTRRMSWGEAWRLTQLLARDTSSQVAAALGGWEFPASREVITMWDHYDLAHRIAAGKKTPPPYPRPWSMAGPRKGTPVSVEEWEKRKAARLARAGDVLDKKKRPRDARGRFAKSTTDN